MKHLLLTLTLFLSFTFREDTQSTASRDIKNIEYLFEDLIDDHDFSYAIFGSKPMSLADYSLRVPSGLPPSRWMRSQFLMAKRKTSLNAWYKNKDKFDLKDFIFLDEEVDLISSLVLIMINKKNMLCTLREHAAIFKEELGDSFEPDRFLKKLERKETSLAKAIHHNQKLLGIMLGYGVRNATLFQERCELIKAIEMRKKAHLQEEETLKQKLEALETQVKCFNELDADAVIHPLYFLADPSHPETIALKQKYEKERQQIIELRKKRNFMNLVLKRLVMTD